jgi:peptidoglycan hydrolase CwlO-like protein
MAKRKKRLEKQIKGIQEQIEKHERKLKGEKGRKDTTKDYWKKEITKLEEKALERSKLVKKLSKNKRS